MRLAVAVLLALVSPVPAFAVLNADQCRILVGKLRDLELLNFPATGVQMSPGFQNLAATHAITDFKSQHPELGGLLDLLTAESAGKLTTAELKSKLQDWANAHAGGARLIYLPELRVLAEDYVRRGLLPWKDPRNWVSEENGYIDDALWNQLIADGRFPVVDPHDLLTHLPTLVNKDFRAAMVDKAKLSTRVYGVLGYRERPGPPPRYRPGYRAAIEAVEVQVGRRLREETWENLNFLVREDGKMRLVMHGNHAMRIPRPLYQIPTLPKGRFDRVKRMLGAKTNVDAKTDALANEFFPAAFDGIHPRTLPRFQQYVQARGEQPTTAYSEYRRAEDAIGVGPGNKQSRARLEKLAREVAASPAVQGKQEDAYAEAFLTELGNRIAADPKLAASFDLPNRIAYFRSANRLYQDYLDWAEANSP